MPAQSRSKTPGLSRQGRGHTCKECQLVCMASQELRLPLCIYVICRQEYKDCCNWQEFDLNILASSVEVIADVLVALQWYPCVSRGKYL